MSENQPPPVICTLTTKELAGRRLEWADLRDVALAVERRPDGLVASYPIDLADAVEDLAARELECCGTWMTIRTRRSDSSIWLEVRTENPDGLSVVHSMIESA